MLSHLSERTNSAVQKVKRYIEQGQLWRPPLEMLCTSGQNRTAMTSEVSPEKIRKAASALPRSLDGAGEIIARLRDHVGYFAQKTVRSTIYRSVVFTRGTCSKAQEYDSRSVLQPCTGSRKSQASSPWSKQHRV